ncbi:YhbD family protein [Paenibacillus sp. JX-17]|uniref:YhbD family protein n=1 Tax=Paenibacillus lacisoli TaxID=3064525 RepID=A0ABT9CBG8_9BACL|nr:YhbD family protein [Paenibacillus sp. JX-17]MDO7906603.1 YhbD family protein [Paenibacillus sp. JX-17]
MEDHLISKKELLELTDISYGQLYRWKRKNLIPEEWFIRRSSFTGQETFFPRDKIIPRINRIKHMKDDLSLDELADVFAPTPGDLKLDRDQLLERNIVSDQALNLFLQIHPAAEFDFDRLLAVYMLDQLLRSGEITREEGISVVYTLTAHLAQLKDRNGELCVWRKMGVPFIALTDGRFYADPEVKEIVRLPLQPIVEKLKLTINEGEEREHV